MNNKGNRKPTDRAAEAARIYRGNGSDTDPLGSYTGVPFRGEEPTQDADDL